MARELQNYCGPHGERYALYCRQCVKDWHASLTPIERALVDHRGHHSVTEAKRLVEKLRGMTLV